MLSRPVQPSAEKRRRPGRLLRRVLLAILAGLMIRTVILMPVRVSGSSMNPTLRSGEVMLVTHFGCLSGAPGRQDVVVCYYPNRYVFQEQRLLRQYFVKRLIGLPGDTVEIVRGQVYINGSPLDEPYLDPAFNKSAASMAAVTLGEDEYFVLGDNRDNSNDSRSIGPIPGEMLVGRVQSVFWPFARRRLLR